MKNHPDRDRGRFCDGLRRRKRVGSLAVRLMGWGLLVACGLIACLRFADPAANAVAAEKVSPSAEVAAFFKANCYACHDADTHEGGLDLTGLNDDLADAQTFARWVRIHDRVSAGEMPPKGETRPEEAATKAMLATLSKDLNSADRARRERSGRSGPRRLSRAEFEWTLRDLLGVPGLRIQENLPADGKSHGFDRLPESLDFSFIHMETYLAAVDAALDAATPTFTRQPPTTVHRFKPWEEMSASIGVVVRNKEALGLIGLERDETFTAVHPKIIDEEPKATAIGVFRHGDADFRYTMSNYTPMLDGFYRIRISGYSIGWDGKKVVPTDRHAAVSFGIFSEGLDYGLVDLPPNKAAVGEITAWLRRGGGMTHGLHDTLYFTAETNERIRDYAHGKNKDVLGPLREAPGLAVEWIEVEGPIIDTWPPTSQKSLFGDLPVRQWTEETDSPQPIQQKWPRGKHPNSKPADIYGVRNEKRPIVQVVSTQPDADARRLLASFLRRAFRRPVSDADLQTHMAIFSERRAAGDHFQDALKAAYRAALTSPDFMLIGVRRDQFELASRLSYFLWSSTPDDTLLDLAERGELAKPEVLRAQAERLLADPKSKRFVDDFTGQWLRLREIDATQPDKQLYPEFSPLLQTSMLAETRAYFAELLRSDSGIAHLVKSDFAMLNEPLARHYGIAGVAGHAIRSVPVAESKLRGPFLTQASVLKVTANGTTTSPVTRGAFVMEKLLGIVPTPPPPDAGAIEPDTRGATTVREQLEKHKRDATCASCHVKMDPYGFALESFDVMGEERTRYRVRGGPSVEAEKKYVHGQPIGYHYERDVDSTGQLPNGRPFKNFAELRAMLAADDAVLARAFLGHLIAYSTGAAVSFGDRADIQQVLTRSKSKQYGLRTLILEAVTSPIFSQQ